MKILYVSQYFPPEMGAPSARVYELSKHWVKAGHQVTVLTGFPNHPTGIVPPEYRRQMRRLTVRERMDGIDVIRSWLYPAPNRQPIERMLVYGSFCVSACLRGAFLTRHDLVIGTSPQLLIGLSGWWISRIKRCPFVFEVRDLWPESLIASGIGHRDAFLIRSLDKLASFLYQRADRIVAVTDALKDHMTKEISLPEEKIDVVENGVEIEKFQPGLDSEDLRRQLDLTGKFVIAYIGTIGYAHGLDVVLDAARRVRESVPEAVFLLVGEGAEKARLKEAATRQGLSNVLFVGQQPRDQVPRWINVADVCLVPLRKEAVFQTVLPSKMLEFMACGRAIVLGVDGHARRILDEAQAGLYVSPGDATALAGALMVLYRNSALRFRLGKNGREFVIKHYSRKQKALQYLHVLECLIAPSKPELSSEALGRSHGILGVCSYTGNERTESEPAWKRLFDITLASCGLALLSPVWLLISVMIYLDDGRPIFYARDRVGKGGRRFLSWKFRTMIPNSDQRYGPLQAREKDERVTRIGRLLRATAMDELPQLWNILKGDMSIVGPRALVPDEIEVGGDGKVVSVENIRAYEERHRVRPGLTGLAQVYAPRDIPRRNKFRYDLLYIKKRSFRLDLKLMILSFWISLRGKWESRALKF